MNAELIDALGRALAHFLWEGAVLALFLALFARAAARVRYAVACAALAAMPLAFGLTLALMWESPLASPRPAAIPIAAAAASAGGASAPLPAAAGAVWQWLVPLWMAGVAVFYLRSVGGWVAARRLRTAGVQPAAGEWQERMHLLSSRLGVTRAVRLVESCLTEVPVVIGYLRPVILLPMGLATGMPREQVEALLIHELAHIRRHDYLVNLLQSAIEGLLFYHPAVWWVSHVIRTEREHCCDDAVVALRGDARGYAGALAALEAMRTPAPLLAASGGSLLRRVQRLLGHQEGPQGGAAALAAGAILVLGAATLLPAWQQTAPPQPAPPKPPAAPRRLLAQERKQGDTPAVRRDVATPYEKWVNEDVLYIIDDREREAFNNLQSDAEREHFIEQFWQRRDPTPGTPENEFKEEHYRRIAYANEHFSSDIPGWRTDAGRYYIVYGPPDEKESHPGEGYEIWHYRLIEGIGRDVSIHIDLHPPKQQEPPQQAHMGPLAIHDPRQKSFVQHLTNAPYFDHVDGDGNSVFVGNSGSAVAVGAKLVTIRVDTGAATGESSNVYARITTATRRVVTTSEAVAQGATWSHQVPLAPGIYRLETVRKNLARGDVVADEVQFQVK